MSVGTSIPSPLQANKARSTGRGFDTRMEVAGERRTGEQTGKSLQAEYLAKTTRDQLGKTAGGDHLRKITEEAEERTAKHWEESRPW